MPFEYATRLRKIPPYLFVEIEEKVKKKRQEGMDIIDFGIGDPDIPTPQPIVDEVKRQLDDPLPTGTSAASTWTWTPMAKWPSLSEARKA
jgi:aspartate/methionine/tyrosine aminotransferase